MSIILKSFLFEKYGGFADKRYKKIENDVPFKLDHTEYDIQDHVCSVFAWITHDGRIKIVFCNNPPYTKEIMDIIKDFNGKGDKYKVELTFGLEDLNVLTQLVRIIRHAKEPYYRWARDRACEALEELKEYLIEYMNRSASESSY